MQRATDRPRDASPLPAPTRGFAYWRENLKLLPNQITASRLAFIPVLWVLALMGKPVWVGVGLGIAASTDMLDGWLSRRWGQTTAFGSRLDSFADHLLTTSTFAWLLMLERPFFREQLLALVFWIVFALAVLGVSLLKFRRWADLHLYSSKAAVIVGFVFAVSLLVLDDYSRPLWYLTLGIATAAVAESLFVILTHDRVDEHIGSILIRRRKPAGE